MSLPEPGSPDLNSSEGSSCPTYSAVVLSNVSAQSDAWLEHSGSCWPAPVSLDNVVTRGLADADCSAPSDATASAKSAAVTATLDGRRLRRSPLRPGRFMLPPFPPVGRVFASEGRAARVSRRPAGVVKPSPGALAGAPVRGYGTTTRSGFDQRTEQFARRGVQSVTPTVTMPETST